MASSPIQNQTTARDSDAPEDGKLDQILRISARHFYQKGFEVASLDEIAKEVGLHKATLYHYVESKHDILYRCLSRSFQDYDETLDRITNSRLPVRDRLTGFFTTFAHAQNNEFGRCLSAVGAQALDHEPGGRIRQFQRGLNNAVIGLLREGIAQGEIRDLPPETASALIFGSFNWIWRWHKPGGHFSLDDVVAAFVDLFFHGLAARTIPIPPLSPTKTSPVAPAQYSEKHLAILMAAAQCCTEKGYDATSLNDISAKVGLHKATLYHYVRSKDSILFQCLEASFTGLDQTEAALLAPGPDAAQKFCLFLEQLVLAQNNDFGRCLNLVGPHPLQGASAEKIRSFQKRLDQMARRVFDAGKASGDFRPLHSGLTAAYVFGATNWVPHWHSPKTATPLTQILPVFEDIFLNGILKA